MKVLKISTIAIDQIGILKKGKDIRHIKSTGSNKIGKVCPSHIETLQDNKTVSVKYWKIHCGHGVEELGRIKLDTA